MGTGCSHPWNWCNQTTTHSSDCWEKFPLIGELASAANSVNDFDQRVYQLSAADRFQYNAEKDLWWKEYGWEWDENDCSKETSPGSSGGSSWVKPADKTPAGRTEVEQIQQALKDRNYDPGKIDGKWGPNTCGAAYRYKKEKLTGHHPELDFEFFTSLGFGMIKAQEFEDKYKNSCDAWAAKYFPPTVSDVTAIQQALGANGYLKAPYSGKWDPTTCKALLSFQSRTPGLEGKKGILDSATFIALGFSQATAKLYESLYLKKCEVAEVPDPVKPSEPKPKTVTCVHGKVSNGKCVCSSGWSGSTCNTPTKPTDPCASMKCDYGCKDGKCNPAPTPAGIPWYVGVGLLIVAAGVVYGATKKGKKGRR